MARRFRPEEEKEEVEVEVDAAVVAVELHLRRWMLLLLLPPTLTAKRLPIAMAARIVVLKAELPLSTEEKMRARSDKEIVEFGAVAVDDKEI